MTKYARIRFDADIKRDAIKKGLNDHYNRSLEDVLRDLCLSADPDPEVIGVRSTKEEADKLHPDELIVDFLDRFTCHVSCIATEIYEADEDGEFISGSDYDFGDVLNEETTAAILERL